MRRQCRAREVHAPKWIYIRLGDIVDACLKHARPRLASTCHILVVCVVIKRERERERERARGGGGRVEGGISARATKCCFICVRTGTLVFPFVDFMQIRGRMHVCSTLSISNS